MEDQYDDKLPVLFVCLSGMFALVCTFHDAGLLLYFFVR